MVAVGLAEAPSSVELEDVSLAEVPPSVGVEEACHIHTCVCVFGIVVARHPYYDNTPSNACRIDCRSLDGTRNPSSGTAS